MPIQQSELNRLLEESITDRRKEPEFFRALLEATVYAHVPLDDRSGRIRFIQFHAPDGELLLPFFSDSGKSEAAARGRVRSLGINGRLFLESTLGATVILNPNNHWCKLYPEEVRVLLRTGHVAVLESDNYEERTNIAVAIPEDVPERLLEIFREILSTLPDVEAAYLVDMRFVPHLGSPNWVLAVSTPKLTSTRICRAILADLQLQEALTDKPLSLLALPLEDPAPDWAAELRPEPIYRRG
jgi:SseB protein N-terminal domain/SseB protein C-terminal domain